MSKEKHSAMIPANDLLLRNQKLVLRGKTFTFRVSHTYIKDGVIDPTQRYDLRITKAQPKEEPAHD